VLAVLVSIAVAFATRGVPFDREQVLFWCWLVAVAVAWASERSPGVAAVWQWAAFALIFAAYDLGRGLAGRLGMPVQATLAATADRTLFGTLPTRWLQHHLYGTGGIGRWEIAVSLVYASHFIVPFAVAAWWWARDRTRWWSWVRRLVLLTGVALVTFALLPTQPPWLASENGVIPPVGRTAERGWNRAGFHVAQALIDKGRLVTNQVAAFPSLHAGYAMLLALFVWRTGSWPLRIVTCLYALAMGFVLVLTGEHWAVDVLAGWLCALAVHVVISKRERRTVASIAA
jgi:membrane-associated phospholipid phosphatase